MSKLTYRNMTIEHMGDDAKQRHLDMFVAACEQYQSKNSKLSDEDVTDTMWGDGDWLTQAANLGIIVTTEAEVLLTVFDVLFSKTFYGPVGYIDVPLDEAGRNAAVKIWASCQPFPQLGHWDIAIVHTDDGDFKVLLP